MNTLWEHKNDPWVDSIIVFIYSGWRISELLNLKISDVDLTNNLMVGGTKTKSGKNRIVPIHHKIRPIIEKRIENATEYVFEHNGKKCSISSYRIFWRKIMSNLNMNHTPHECRHTFRTLLDRYNANEKCCDLLMGHASQTVGNRIYNHKTIEDLKTAIELILL